MKQEKMNKMKVIRYLVYTAQAFGCFFLQTVPGAMPEFFSEKPALLITAALCAAVFEEERGSVLYGALCGALADCAAVTSRGFYGIALSAACYAVSSLYRERLRRNLLTVFTVSGISAAVITGLHFLLFYIFAGYPEPLVSFTGHYLPELFYTLALIPLFYKIDFLAYGKTMRNRKYY